MLGPHLLGDAPRIYITPPGNEIAEEEDTSEYFPDIKIYDEDVNLKLLICGAHCTLVSLSDHAYIFLLKYGIFLIPNQ
jgi:hypothetical protein